jgi:hypothetical protein
MHKRFQKHLASQPPTPRSHLLVYFLASMAAFHYTDASLEGLRSNLSLTKSAEDFQDGRGNALFFSRKRDMLHWLRVF